MLDVCRAARTRLLKIDRICCRPAYIRLGDDDVVFVIAVERELSMMKGLSMTGGQSLWVLRTSVSKWCVQMVCSNGMTKWYVASLVPMGDVLGQSKTMLQSCADLCFAMFDVGREC